jgi:hypothetical protein
MNRPPPMHARSRESGEQQNGWVNSAEEDHFNSPNQRRHSNRRNGAGTIEWHGIEAMVIATFSIMFIGFFI